MMSEDNTNYFNYEICKNKIHAISGKKCENYVTKIDPFKMSFIISTFPYTQEEVDEHQQFREKTNYNYNYDYCMECNSNNS